MIMSVGNETQSVTNIEGISNIAVDVASSASNFNTIFSQQNKKHSVIKMHMITYQNTSLLKSLLTDVSRKVMSRYNSGLNRKLQIKLRKEVIISRYLGLLPYVK